MIVVVGAPAWRDLEPVGPAGRACEIAVACAAVGMRVELVGRVGDDPPGDALLIALARAGVGHAAVLRDPVRPTAILRRDPEPVAVLLPEGDEAAAKVRSDGPLLEPADVRLALSYLTAFGVLVVADDAPADVLAACVDGAAFAEAALVVLVPEGAAAPEGLPAGATVLAAPDAADDGVFAGLVGAFAAALDQGATAADAFRAATAGAGWTEVVDPA